MTTPFEDLQARIKRDGWTPDLDTIVTSNVAGLMSEVGIDPRVTGSYEQLHTWTVTHREDFWGRMIRTLGIRFKRAPDRILDSSSGDVETVQWLPGAQMNIVDSCFKADPDKTAIYYGQEGSSTIREVSYRDLEALTNRVANGLGAAGFNPGDRIGIYMPMTLESVAIYLGIVKAGCAAVCVADSFSAAELKKRLEIAGATGIFTVDTYQRAGKGIDLFSKVRDADAPRAIVVPYDSQKGASGLRDGDMLWENFLSTQTAFESVTRDATDYTNILFSSGTTGDPKAIPWMQRTPIDIMVYSHLHNNVTENSVLTWYTNLGWVMGSWLIYATLGNNASMALFNGGYDTREYAEFISKTGVTMFGVVPALVKSWKKSKVFEGVDLSKVEVFGSTGESSNADDYAYLMALPGEKDGKNGRPVVECCGGTEIGYGYLAGTVVKPSWPGELNTPALGIDFVILGDDDSEVAPGGEGELFLIPPLGIGASQRLLNRDHHVVYFEDCPRGPHGEVLRRHGDYVKELPEGRGYVVLGRADDTMNLNGIKVSSIELETTLNRNPYVTEVAAIAVPQPGGGASQLIVYAVLNDTGKGVDATDFRRSLQATMKSLNPLYQISDVVPIDALPRTTSNKVMRKDLRRDYVAKRV